MPTVEEVTCFLHSMLDRPSVETLEQFERMMLKAQYQLRRVSFCYLYRSLDLTFPNKQLALVVYSTLRQPSRVHTQYRDAKFVDFHHRNVSESVIRVLPLPAFRKRRFECPIVFLPKEQVLPFIFISQERVHVVLARQRLTRPPKAHLAALSLNVVIPGNAEDRASTYLYRLA